MAARRVVFMIAVLVLVFVFVVDGVLEMSREVVGESRSGK
jgi:hypothetical protein